MEVKTLGIDLAKQSFQLHGVDSKGHVVLRRKIKREEMILFVSNLPRCEIIMEACGTSSHWGRKFQAMGHRVKLIAPQFVKPFVKSQKNDRNDAEAIVEAGTRPSMRFVAIKAKWQQDIQALHRARRRTIRGRVALVNQTKGLLGEYGVTISEAGEKFKQQCLGYIEDANNDLTSAIRLIVSENLREYDFLIEQIKTFDKELKLLAKSSEECQRLLEVPGVGYLGATAFVASIGDPKTFKNGRQVGGWLGLVPRQHSTGGVAKLLSITKRGDPELRAILIHGARAVLLSLLRTRKQDRLSLWAMKLLEQKGWNKASVALANRMARIMWHILNYKVEYRMAV